MGRRLGTSAARSTSCSRRTSRGRRAGRHRSDGPAKRSRSPRARADNPCSTGALRNSEDEYKRSHIRWSLRLFVPIEPLSSYHDTKIKLKTGFDKTLLTVKVLQYHNIPL